MKKFLRGLIITLVVLIVLPIALVFIFLFDTGKMSVNYDDDFSKDNWSKALVVDSLDYAPENKMLRFSVSEDDINNFIYSAIKDNSVVNQYLTQLAVDIRDDCYVLNVSGKYSFFETRAKLTAKITKENVLDESGKEQPAFVLTVDKMSLGRLTKLKGIINYAVKQFIDDKTIDALTSSLKLHSDLNNFRFYIFTSDLRDMLNEGLSSGGGSGEKAFYLAFLNDFLDKNLISIDFYGGETLTVDVNLEPLTGNDYNAEAGDNVYYPMEYDKTLTKLIIKGTEKKLSLNTIREALVSLLDDGLITSENLTLVSDYLFQGYTTSSKAPACDLTSIGIPSKEAYQGFNLVPAFSIDDTIKSDISTFASYSESVNSFDIAELTENDINQFLKSQSVFGNKFFMQRALPGNKNKLNYIALDNAYLNVYGNNAIITVGLNINGLETIVTLKMELDSTNTNTKQLVYLPAKIYFGKESANLQLSKDSEEVVFDALYQSVNSSAFKFDKNGKMTISFDSLIKQAADSINTGNPVIDGQYKAFLKNSNTSFAVNVEGNAVTDNSVIKIKAIRN